MPTAMRLAFSSRSNERFVAIDFFSKKGPVCSEILGVKTGYSVIDTSPDLDIEK